MRFLGLLFVFSFSILSAYTQNIDKSIDFINRITLRKSFQSINVSAQPAVITYTKAKNKDASWLLNAAIGYDLFPKSKKNLTFSLFFEYHKNTLVDKEQENLQSGFSFEWQVLENPKWTPVLISSVNYNKDQIKDISSIQGNLYATPIFLLGVGYNPKYFWRPNTYVKFNDNIKFIYSPYIGLEHENRFSASEELNEGQIYRIYFRVYSNFSFFQSNDKLKDKFEIDIDWQYRNNFKENVSSLTKSTHKYFSASFNYIFFSANDGNKNAKIGIDYVNGENPINNFEEQSFYAVSLKIKL